MTVFFRVDVAASVFAILAGSYHLSVFAGWIGSVPVGALDLFWRLGWSVAAVVVLTVLFAIGVAAFERDGPARDEREVQLEFRATRNTGMVYAFGLITLLWNAFRLADPMQLAHAVIAILVLAELVRLGSLAVYLRRAI